MLRIAFASTDPVHVDLHFGGAEQLVIFDVAPGMADKVGIAAFDKARALLKGRTYVATEDVKAVAMPVLRHRIVTNYNADADRVSPDEIVRKLLALVPARATE